MKKTLLSFSSSKLLKEKGFDLESEYFYSKSGTFYDLKPHREYEHLHSYSGMLFSYFDGKYNWNSLDVDGGMIGLKTSFSESDGFVNCECSAPFIFDVVMWLYEKHGIWINANVASFSTDTLTGERKIFLDYTIYSPKEHEFINDQDENRVFKSPIEAYESAIEYTLKNLI